MDNKQETTQFPGKGVHWITDPLEERPIKIGESGPSSFVPETVIQKFKATAGKFAEKNALSVKRDGQWVHWTWKQYYDQAMQTAKALIHLGAAPGKGVAIIGFNSPEWFLADLGSIAAGAIAAPIYTTNNPEAVRYIADHCKAPIALAENEFQLKKFLSVKNQLPELKALVQWSGKIPEGDFGIPIYTWQEFLKLSEKTSDEELQKRIDELKPARVATLIYTSGTTGPPKGVMISHDNVTWTAKVAAQMLGMTENEDIISYLPLSHIAAQMVDLHAPISVGAHVFFAQPDALKGSLLETLKDVRPTLFLGVPRVWEKIQEKMMSIGKTVTGFKKTIADAAKKIGLEANYAIQNNQSTPWGYWLADKVVFSKIKEALGLDRSRLCGTAAAPISKETLEYFLSINIPIFEIYGMSECSGPQTINSPSKWKTGSCGPSISGTELKIDNPDKEGNGEICYRGRHVFLGYMYNDKETAGAIDGEGWLHSGDVGIVKGDFLFITGRIKELLITAGGENIPPVLIEEEIRKEVGQVVSNIMLIGDRRKFLSVVFTLRLKQKANSPLGEYGFTDEIAPDALEVLKKIGSNVTTATEAIDDPKLKEYLTEGIKRANKRAASNAQNVQKFFIVPKDFTIETGELTPSLKLKRKVVAENLKDQIEKLYAESENAQ